MDVATHQANLAKTQKLADAPDELEQLVLPVEQFQGEEAPPYPDVLIEGLLRKQEMIIMGGEAKNYKSWARADMLYCIGNGFNWLGFPCHQGVELDLDFVCFSPDVCNGFSAEQHDRCRCHFKGFVIVG